MPSTTGVVRCRKETCVKSQSEVLCLHLSGTFELNPAWCLTLQRMTAQGMASVAHCECISLQDALLARGLYLVHIQDPSIALSTNVLDFFCVLKHTSPAPVAGIEVVLTEYFRIKGSHIVSAPLRYLPDTCPTVLQDPILLTPSINAAATRYYEDHFQHALPEPMQGDAGLINDAPIREGNGTVAHRHDICRSGWHR